MYSGHFHYLILSARQLSIKCVGRGVWLWSVPSSGSSYCIVSVLPPVGKYDRHWYSNVVSIRRSAHRCTNVKRGECADGKVIAWSGKSTWECM